MTGAPGAQARSVAWLVCAATWLMYVATAGGSMATGDAVAMFEAAKSLVDRGSMDVPPSQSSEAWRGADGLYYTPFGIGQSLYDIPFLLAGRAAGRITGVSTVDADFFPKAFVAGASTLPAAVAGLFGCLLAWRLSGDLRASALGGFAISFGTLLWPYSKFGFNAALTAGGLTAGLYGLGAGAADRSARTLAGGGAALGLALLTRHEMTIAAVVSIAWLAWCVRREPARNRLLAAASLPVCSAIALWMTLNAMRFGDPFRTGHAPAFSLAGTAAFLVSPSGALALYAPPAIAGLALISLARQGHALAWLLGAVSLAMFIFYASLEDWLGTRSYGPRYLVPLVPALTAPLAVWIARARSGRMRSLVIALCAMGALVQVPAVAVDFSRAGIAAGQPPQTVRRDDWRWAPVWVNARAIGPAMRSSLRSLGVPSRVAPDAQPAADAATRSPALDFWWLHLFELGLVSRPVAVLAGVLPVIGAVFLARRALQQAGGRSQ
jgi:hypothetical protein